MESSLRNKIIGQPAGRLGPNAWQLAESLDELANGFG